VGKTTQTTHRKREKVSKIRRSWRL
jgi:hypothetical protein